MGCEIQVNMLENRIQPSTVILAFFFFFPLLKLRQLSTLCSLPSMQKISLAGYNEHSNIPTFPLLIVLRLTLLLVQLLLFFLSF
jgi:hypothetical protein